MEKNSTGPERELIMEQKSSEPYLFVHINKTAGMSFRDSLDESQSAVYDYGIDGPRTSKIILEKIYAERDPYGLYNEIGGSATWLAGHFRLMRHSDFVDCRRIVTIVRDPLKRVISNFNHIRSNVDSSVNIDEYVDGKHNQNIQHKYLLGLPHELIGFVGITEKINESYELINSGLSVDLNIKYSNRNTTKTIRDDAISSDLRDRIKEHNKLDYVLYDWALKNHQERYRFYSEGKSWCHGYYTITDSEALYGVAFFEGSEEVVEVNVFKNGVHKDTLVANLFHANHVKPVFPRRRYVAFRMPNAKPEDDYDVFVAGTGQKLNLRT